MRHDYKPSAEHKARNNSALPWFAAGLGIPLLGIAFAFIQTEPGDNPVPDSIPNRAVGPASAGTADPAATRKFGTTVANVSNLPLHKLGIPDGLLDSRQRSDGEKANAVAEELHDAARDEALTGDSGETVNFHPPLELAPEHDRIQLTVMRGDTLDRLFRRNNLSLKHLAMMLKLPDAAPHLKKLMPGDELVIEHDDGSLVSFYRELTLTSAIQVVRNDTGFSAILVDRPIEIRRKRAIGSIQSSLFVSAMEAGIQDRTVMNLAGIFAWDVDFVLDIRSGDYYSILFEELYQDGEYISDGEIIAAEFNNNGRTIQAIRFIDSDGRSDYFTPDGRSIRKAFVRAPVDFTRISSNFNPNRKHPILNRIRAHRGVDYAAPRGTPIKAAGDGKVIYRGVKNGYGNVVILQHGGNITTLYAHMSSFDKKAGIGRRVVQGQVIGYVGRTGLATANHLHYEYRLNGVHRNPRTVSLPQAAPIKEEYRDRFLASVEPILDELLQQKKTQVAPLTAD